MRFKYHTCSLKFLNLNGIKKNSLFQKCKNDKVMNIL